MTQRAEDDATLDATPSRTLVAAPDVRGRLDAWLAMQCPDVSRARIQMLIKEGQIMRDGERVKASDKITPGAVYSITFPPPEPATPQPEDIPLAIVYEDDDCLVINKPAGLVVHPAPGHATGTLVNALLFHCKTLGGIGGVERPGIVHRLDMDTSGLMIVAKNDRAMMGFTSLFQAHGVHKIYRTLVHGVPRALTGTLVSMIGRHPIHRQKMAIVTRGGKEAITHYAVLSVCNNVSYVECRIETGRTHQIRVHMHSLGCPVIGDTLYGKSSLDAQLTPPPARQMLHAAHLDFIHPVTGASLSFEAPVPEDFTPYVSPTHSDRV